jgi:hypothetical protein
MELTSPKNLKPPLNHPHLPTGQFFKPELKLKPLVSLQVPITTSMSVLPSLAMPTTFTIQLYY